jgi:hypothetical protein
MQLRHPSSKTIPKQYDSGESDAESESDTESNEDTDAASDDLDTEGEGDFDDGILEDAEMGGDDSDGGLEGDSDQDLDDTETNTDGMDEDLKGDLDQDIDRLAPQNPISVSIEQVKKEPSARRIKRLRAIIRRCLRVDDNEVDGELANSDLHFSGEESGKLLIGIHSVRCCLRSFVISHSYH